MDAGRLTPAARVLVATMSHRIFFRYAFSIRCLWASASCEWWYATPAAKHAASAAGAGPALAIAATNLSRLLRTFSAARAVWAASEAARVAASCGRG